MSFLLLEASNIEKSFSDVQILNVKNFKIYAGDRIGFIGPNGSGKTTLLNILSGEMRPDSGTITRYCDIAYIRQFGMAGGDIAESAAKLGQYGVLDKAENPTISGGEATRIKLAHALSTGHRLIFADEPTSNLDIHGIKQFSHELAALESFILISHDRVLLNKHCNRIITLEKGDIATYEGNFDAYKQQADAKRRQEQFEYEQYESEKERLQKVYADKKSTATKLDKKPKGMSSSEAKMRNFVATSRSFGGKARRMEQAAKAVQSRIDSMEVKERPAQQVQIKLDFALTNPPHNKIVLSGSGISVAYGPAPHSNQGPIRHWESLPGHAGLQILFENAAFEIKNGARVAVQGPNGSGKTTLLNLIWQGDRSVYRVPKARIGYFRQGFENIDMSKTVLQNAMEDSVQTETTVRSILARLLFARGDIKKPAHVLSGGERVKLSLAKLLVSGCNVLLMDEPTNYLDMPSLEVLQAILREYEGTLLFVSHDREFINAVCTELLVIRERQLISFIGNLDDYDSQLQKKAGQDRMLQEHKLAALAGEIAKCF